MRNRIDFVLMSDANYVWQLTTAIAGIICACRKRQCTVHVIDCGISDGRWADLRHQVEHVARRHCIDMTLKRLFPDMGVLNRMNSYRGTIATYSRLLIPGLMPDVDVCVYVDCDVLMIDDMVTVVDQFERSGCLVGGHVDIESTRQRESEFLRCNGLPILESEYLCCGLLLMNLARLRREEFTGKAFQFLDDHQDVPFADQSAINNICAGGKYIVEDGWCLMACECYGDVPVRAIHYAGCCPWSRIPSWYEYIAFSRVADIWYAFCEHEFSLVSLRRKYNTLMADYVHALISALIVTIARVLVFCRFPSRRWHSLHRYASACRNDCQVRAALCRMSVGLNWEDA